MTGKEFLEQYAIIDRQIRSVKLQLDGMKKMAERNQMLDDFQSEISELSDRLKNLISRSTVAKKEILEMIQQLDNDNRRETLIKYYIELKTKVQIAREMFISFQGVCYHLKTGATEIQQLTDKNKRPY